MVTKKKKIIMLVVAVVLVAAGVTTYLMVHKKSGFKDHGKTEQKQLFGTKKEKDDDLADRYFELEEGGHYLLWVDGDSVYVTVERVDDEEIAGNYYAMEKGKETVEGRPFMIEAHRKTLNLRLEGRELVFGMKADKLGQLLDGNTHRVTDEEKNRYKMKMEPYREPEFRSVTSDRYRKELYGVKEEKDQTYGRATGYWTSLTGGESESYAHIVGEGLKNTLTAKELDLKMDVYLPEDGGDSTRTKRPLLLFLHGGAFYVGDKSDPAISDWCRHFAATGYVAASINYRMGFLPSKKDIERTGYMATQDAHAAMRYLVDKAERYQIDTNSIFVAGTSAGAITALNLAFMKTRPESAGGKANKSGGQAAGDKKAKQRRNSDLGGLQGTGNTLNNSFHILAVANMWGAVNNLNMLKNGKSAIISFHGDADQLVPYDQGYPFADISEGLGRRLFDQMYGSKAITERAKALGMKAELHTFEGEGHALHLNEDRSRNEKNFGFIRDRITTFFYQVMTPAPVKIAVDEGDGRHYLVDNAEVEQLWWKVEGGFVTRQKGNELWVVWRSDAKKKSIQVSGRYGNGIPFNATRTPKS